MTDISLGKQIASGRTAEIYLWEKNFVLKLFKDWVIIQSVEYEAKINRIVFDSGLPIPSVGEIVKINNRIGLTYSFVEGQSMLDTLCKKPWKFYKYAHLMAKLHVDLHTYSIPQLPLQSERLIHKIRKVDVLSSRIKEKIVSLVETLPDENKLCHGDFHPGNILMADKCPVIIDWIDATCGSPIGDLARTSLLFQIAQLPEDMPSRRVITKFSPWFHNLYIKKYNSIMSVGKDEFNIWFLAQAAARLEENIITEQKQLLKIIDVGLS